MSVVFLGLVVGLGIYSRSACRSLNIKRASNPAPIAEVAYMSTPSEGNIMSYHRLYQYQCTSSRD
jgi:hypothetical protein